MKNVVQKIGLTISGALYCIAIYYSYLAWKTDDGGDGGLFEIIDSGVYMLIGFITLLVFVLLDSVFASKPNDLLLKIGWGISILALFITIAFGLIF